MKKIEEIINIVIEDIRTELCLVDYKKAEELSNFLKTKFKKIEEMLDRQLEVHKDWDNDALDKEGEMEDEK